jgi:hypothetical protein
MCWHNDNFKKQVFLLLFETTITAVFDIKLVESSQEM